MKDWCEFQTSHSKPEKYALFPAATKTFYWYYIETTICYSDSCCYLWAKDLKLDPDILGTEWEKILINTHTVLNASKLRTFQYKLINRVLIINLQRAKWDHSITDTCSFCFQQKETVTHIMINCNEVTKLWKALKNWINRYFAIDVQEFTPRTIIFNGYEGPHSKLINTLILVMKQFIYAVKCKGQQLNFINYLSCPDYWYNIERIASWNSGNYKLFQKKWKKYKL